MLVVRLQSPDDVKPAAHALYAAVMSAAEVHPLRLTGAGQLTLKALGCTTLNLEMAVSVPQLPLTMYVNGRLAPLQSEFAGSEGRLPILLVEEHPPEYEKPEAQVL